MSSSGPELARQQTEVLAEMGAHLYEKRVEAQLTLEQIATQTCIPLRLLTAIEAGNLENLPEPVYTRGLLCRFADAVGLDGREYSTKFPTGIDPALRYEGGLTLPVAPLRPMHLYFAYIVLVVAAVTGISLSFDRMQQPNTELVEDEIEVPIEPTRQPPEPVAIPSEPAVAQNPSPATDVAAQPANAATTTPKPEEKKQTEMPETPKPDGPVSIELTVTSESWLQVLADGEVAFEGILSEGQQAWSADREITVVAGNAGAIMVKVNGGDETELGAPGAVESVTFMADSRAGTAAAQNP